MMKFPKYIRITFDDGDWCAVKVKDEYECHGLVFKHNNELSLERCESYPIEELVELALPHVPITSQEYATFVRDRAVKQVDEYIKSMEEFKSKMLSLSFKGGEMQYE